MRNAAILLSAALALTGRCDLISSFDLGNGNTYTGGGPANPGDSITWTKAAGPGEGPFSDPGTGVALRVFNGTGYINTASAGALALFDDFIYDSGIGGTANWEIQGLNNALAYDLYFIAPNGQQFAANNVYGAIYSSGVQSAPATGATNTFSGWTEGANYAVLRNLTPTGGTIAGLYSQNPASQNPNNFGIAGVQVVAVPEPGTAALSLLGLLLAATRRKGGTPAG